MSGTTPGEPLERNEKTEERGQRWRGDNEKRARDKDYSSSLIFSSSFESYRVRNSRRDDKKFSYDFGDYSSNLVEKIN